jgi:hypothetical protein
MYNVQFSIDFQVECNSLGEDEDTKVILFSYMTNIFMHSVHPGTEPGFRASAE